MDVLINMYMVGFIIICGSACGSFINCMAWRIVHKENVWKGRSHCAVCNHTLGAFDLIPIFSYIRLKGKCRYCKESISKRYLIIELIMAIAFLVITWKFKISFLTLRYLVLACILMIISLVDMDSYEIPDGSVIAGVIWWIITLPLIEAPLQQLTAGVIGAITIGGGMLLFSLLMDYILQKESMGGGDIKLFFMLALYLGPLLGLLHLTLSCFIGILFVIVFKKNKIPFGPAISLAFCITALWGGQVVKWYLDLYN